MGEGGADGGGEGGSGEVSVGDMGQYSQVSVQISMKSACLHLVILSLIVPTSFWQYFGSLGLFSSVHGDGGADGGDLGEGGADGGGEGGGGEGGGGEGGGGLGEGGCGAEGDGGGFSGEGGGGKGGLSFSGGGGDGLQSWGQSALHASCALVLNVLVT